MLLALIGRGVAFEYRGKVRRRALAARLGPGDHASAPGSPPLGVGLIIATTVLGLPLDADGDRVGSPFAAFRPETLLGGLAVAGFALLHGAAFLALKTEGDIRAKARRFALRIAPVAVAADGRAAAGGPGAARARRGRGHRSRCARSAAVAVCCGCAAGRDGQAFALLGVASSPFGVTLFGALYPDVLPSTCGRCAFADGARRRVQRTTR